MRPRAAARLYHWNVTDTPRTYLRLWFFNGEIRAARRLGFTVVGTII